jgi:hypothetical protein
MRTTVPDSRWSEKTSKARTKAGNDHSVAAQTICLSEVIIRPSILSFQGTGVCIESIDVPQFTHLRVIATRMIEEKGPVFSVKS